MRKRPSGEKSEENLTMGVSVCHHQNQRSNLGITKSWVTTYYEPFNIT